MSFYATMQGKLTYPDKESFDRMVNLLKEHKYLDAEGYFLDECGDRIHGDISDVNQKNLSIDIPLFYHRNLSRVDFFLKKDPPKTGKVKGEIVGTSTDSCFEGWTIDEDKEENFDLEEWAKENLEDEDQFPPNKDDYDDEDEYYQNLSEWQSLVECEFHSDFG